MKNKKAKAIICRPTEEFATYLGNGDFATCDTPILFPLTFTLEGLKEIVKKQEDIDLDIDNYYATIVEINEV